MNKKTRIDIEALRPLVLILKARGIRGEELQAVGLPRDWLRDYYLDRHETISLDNYFRTVHLVARVGIDHLS